MPDPNDVLLAGLDDGDVDAIVAGATRLLDRVILAPSCLAATYHPVGFVHAPLGALADGGRNVRLHIWPVPRVTPQDPNWPIHSHAWHLTSYVITGQVRNSLFRVTEQENAARRLYRVGYEDDTSILEATQTVVACDHLYDENHELGARYEVVESAFHTTSARGGVWACTVVVTEPSGPHTPSVVGDVDGDTRYSYRRSAVSDDDLRRMAKALRSG